MGWLERWRARQPSIDTQLLSRKSGSSAHSRQLTNAYNFNSKGSATLFWPLQAPAVHTHTLPLSLPPFLSLWKEKTKHGVVC